MGIDAIKTGNITNMPQFKAAKDAGNATKPETKENGNALLYGSIAALAVVGLGIAYKAYKGKAKDFDKLKELGYKFENKLFVDKEGKKFTGKVAKKNAVITFKDGVRTESVIKPKEGDVKEIINTFDEAGKIKNRTTKMKEGDYKEIKTTFTRENDKVVTLKEGVKSDGTTEKISTITRQKNGDKIQVTKETLGKDGKMVQETKDFTIKKGDGKNPDTPANGGETPKPDTPTNGGDTPKPDTPANGGDTPKPDTPANGGDTPQPDNPFDGKK